MELKQRIHNIDKINGAQRLSRDEEFENISATLTNSKQSKNLNIKLYVSDVLMRFPRS